MHVCVYICVCMCVCMYVGFFLISVAQFTYTFISTGILLHMTVYLLICMSIQPKDIINVICLFFHLFH